MDSHLAERRRSRREFLKVAASAASALCLGPRLGRVWAQTPSASVPVPATGEVPIAWRSLSVKRLPEVKDWLARLEREDRISANRVFRGYVHEFRYALPETMPNAKSIIVLSRPQNVCAVTFRSKGRSADLLIPTGYVDDGFSREALEDHIRRKVLKNPSARLGMTTALPLKTLANRTGLAEHGRNNITFVGASGSFHKLRAFYTDQPMEDHWGPLRMMRLCKGCSICRKACPTGAISETNFIIDVGKCLTLYSELPEPLPAWIDPKAHNALVGCLRCQWTCPANAEVAKSVERLAELSEEETALVLEGGRDSRLQESIIGKLKRFPAAGLFDYFCRNARLAWANLPNT
jgi:epoxyqueuosine reductase